jgi:hypothetical protein
MTTSKANDETPKAKAAARPDFVKAVFIGHGGFSRDREWFFPEIWVSRLPISKSGTLVPLRNSDGFPVNPELNPEFSHWAPISFSPGDTVMVPAYNDTIYERAVKSRQYALESYADKINKWYDDGVSGDEILAKIEGEDGLIKFLDGSAPMKAASPAG